MIALPDRPCCLLARIPPNARNYSCILARPAKSMGTDETVRLPFHQNHRGWLPRLPIFPGSLCIADCDGNRAMFDELERLRAEEDLHRLLAHYAERGEAERDAWQDRVMEWDGGSKEDLVRLHGALLAFEWIELNVGVVVSPQPG